ncbi:MAG: hypothetical protein AAF497_18670 [Planctomycetota bacterium]
MSLTQPSYWFPRFLVAILILVSSSSASADSSAINSLLKLAAESDPAVSRDIIVGVQEGFRGEVRKVPQAWPLCFEKFVAQNSPCRTEAIQLGIKLGHGPSAAACIQAVNDPSLPVSDRRELIASGSRARIDGIQSRLVEWLDDADLQVAAIRGLANFNNQNVTIELIRRMPQFGDEARQASIGTLAARESSAMELCEDIKRNPERKSWVSTSMVRQLRGIRSPKLRSLVQSIWGTSRRSTGEKRREIDRLKNKLVSQFLAAADLNNGEQLCNSKCLICHQLNGKGKHIGPNLTGAQRYDVYYLLSNVVDPSAEVDRDFQMTIIETTDGRTVNGIVTGEVDGNVTVQTQTDVLRIQSDDIEHRMLSTSSMMPDGILDELSDEQIRDLIAFLMADFRK